MSQQDLFRDTDHTPSEYPFPQESRLYFTVEARPLMFTSKIGAHALRIDQEVALVRLQGDADPLWLANVGCDYQIVQNKDLYRHIEAELIETMPPELLRNVEVNDHMSYNGRWCMRDYRFGDAKVKVGHSDVCFRFSVANGFGMTSIQLMIGAYDLVCSNGMIVGVAERLIKRHTSGFRVEKLSKIIRDGYQKFYEQAEVWEVWNQTEITNDQVEECLKRLPISDRRRDTIMNNWLSEQYERGQTVWALYSAMTNFSTHGTVRQTGHDNSAATRVKRQIEVRGWTNTQAFRALWRKDDVNK